MVDEPETQERGQEKWDGSFWDTLWSGRGPVAVVGELYITKQEGKIFLMLQLRLWEQKGWAAGTLGRGSGKSKELDCHWAGGSPMDVTEAGR